ncbi:YceI family protein [Acuticoccus sp. M5D2P5]|uniref:YceI family protein n=1 Tax=Acuticoccus kalidii TaxID=2910977 RepID=UPI001F398757|nr:YceI family protein [Acuticoccus kalidii]MCF3936640.1 YceI family protein [Acuticoccus kalidii]
MSGLEASYLQSVAPALRHAPYIGAVHASARRAFTVFLAVVLLVPLFAVTAMADVTPGVYRFVPDRAQVRFVVSQDSRRTGAQMSFADGEITFGSGGVVTGGQASIDARSVSSKSSGTVSTLKGRFGFDVAKYPSIRFRATGGSIKGDRAMLSGILTIKGVSHPVEFTGEVLRNQPRRLAIRLEGTVDRTKFGITAGRPLYGKDAKIILRVIAVRDRNGNTRAG